MGRGARTRMVRRPVVRRRRVSNVIRSSRFDVSDVRSVVKDLFSSSADMAVRKFRSLTSSAERMAAGLKYTALFRIPRFLADIPAENMDLFTVASPAVFNFLGAAVLTDSKFPIGFAVLGAGGKKTDRPVFRPDDPAVRERLYRMMDVYLEDADCLYKERDRFTVEELLGFSLIYLFFGFRGKLKIEEVEGRHYWQIAIEKIHGYFDEYLDELAAIENLTKRDIGKLNDPVELFRTIIEVVDAKSIIEDQWGSLVRVCRKAITGDRMFSEMYDLNMYEPGSRGFKTALDRLPAMKNIFDISLARHYKSILRLESRLKQKLRRQINLHEDSRAIVQRVFRAMHNSSVELNDRTFDWLLNFRVPQVEKSINVDRHRHRDEQIAYQGIPYDVSRSIMKSLKLDRDDVLYDLGSGYGRMIFYAALTTDVGRAVGIELVRERVDRCIEVKQRLGLDNVKFMARNIRDVTGYDISDGTVFFLYNPFAHETLVEAVEILKSIAGRKEIRIVSLGPCSGCFNGRIKEGWLRLVKSVEKYHQVNIYQSVRW